MCSFCAKLPQITLQAGEDLGRVVDQVHLVDGGDDVPGSQQRGDVGVTAGLGEDAFAGVHKNNGDIRGGSAGGHVAGVLLVARRVGNDELAVSGGEVAVGYVDGDSLLPLGAQAVGELGKIDRSSNIRSGRFGHGADVVFVDVLRVVKQAADQG